VDYGEECDGGHKLTGHSAVPWCNAQCEIEEGWICFDDHSKPCIKDCPEGEETHGTFEIEEEEEEIAGDMVDVGTEIVPGRGAEPKCSQQLSFTPTSRGIDQYFLTPLPQDHLLFKRKVLPENTSWIATTVSDNAFATDIKFQFKIITLVKRMHIVWGTHDQPLRNTIGNQGRRGDFSFVVVQEPNESGVWVGRDKKNRVNWDYEEGDVVELVMKPSTGEIFEAVYRNGEKHDHGMLWVVDQLKGNTLYTSVNLKHEDSIEIGCFY